MGLRRDQSERQRPSVLQAVPAYSRVVPSSNAAVDVIAAKRDGHPLTNAQIDWIIAAYTRGEVADEQMSALLMAILLNGMCPSEIARWTAAMVESGVRLDLSSVERPVVDKHSTGGVGDKVSLALAPLIAACGVAMPHLAGRGLGYTGGTLDKLESILGWASVLPPERMIRQLSTVGAVICAASPDLSPADRKLYALRDITGTVGSIPMIAASIMSKKIAEGTPALVLDVKVGSGAFMPTIDRARELACTMIELGSSHQVRVSALLTDMSTLLGNAVGNALEVAEALDVLAGGGPADVVELTLALAGEMLALAGVRVDPADVLASGRAMDSWRALVTAQGGDPEAALPVAKEIHTVLATTSGLVSRLDALTIGQVSWRLGAGRARQEDSVQPAAGIRCLVKPGDEVHAGQPILELHTDELQRMPSAISDVATAIEIEPTGSAPKRSSVVLETIRG
jgi:thymidine phosphorylase